MCVCGADTLWSFGSGDGRDSFPLASLQTPPLQVNSSALSGEMRHTDDCAVGTKASGSEPRHNRGRPGQRADRRHTDLETHTRGSHFSRPRSLCEQKRNGSVPSALRSEAHTPAQVRTPRTVWVAGRGVGVSAHGPVRDQAALAARDSSERVVSVSEVHKKPLLPKGPQKQK